MIDEKDIAYWFSTEKGEHIPVREGQTKQEALNEKRRQNGDVSGQSLYELKKNQEIEIDTPKPEVKSIFDQKTFDSVKDVSLEEIRADSGWLSGAGNPDKTLFRILDAKGFTEKPVIETKEHIEKLRKEGCIPLYRGMKPLGTGVKSGAEQYKYGEMFVGRGIHGHGVYFSTDENMANEYLYDKSTGEKGSILSGVLDKTAKIIEESDAKKLSQELKNDLTLSEPQRILLSDIGKVAALYGYDAIKSDSDGIYVILNRSKTIMEG